MLITDYYLAYSNIQQLGYNMTIYLVQITKRSKHYYDLSYLAKIFSKQYSQLKTSIKNRKWYKITEWKTCNKRISSLNNFFCKLPFGCTLLFRKRPKTSLWMIKQYKKFENNFIHNYELILKASILEEECQDDRIKMIENHLE